MNWANFVKEGAPHWEDQKITESLLRSKPWISDIYANKLFKDAPEVTQIRDRGRPRKINPINSAT
jgi:putative transposase